MSGNRLAQSLSPYLLQHAHNPVAWEPWEEAALARARAEGKPIFLSIGYSACHWCHVMERESFENPAVAEVLNAHFVPIKVDREERPDLDDLYMDAVQALTGRGGWPMSVWLTPDLKPFFGGTYFPPEPRGGMPGFIPLLKRIAHLWATQRTEVESQAVELTEELRKQAQVKPGEGLPEAAAFERALEQLRHGFDARWGGFGGAPKFPAQMAVDLILRRGSETDQAMARRTLDAMWEGGMYDHLGGGFARYSVDERWLVPHFEKMLYDNAQLATCYLEAFQASGEPRYAEVARETLDYLLREMRDAGGGLHSTEDADSEGEEGRFYAFTPDQFREALGSEADRAAVFFGVGEGGNFEHGTSVLHRFSTPKGMTVPAEEAARWKAGLFAYRSRRVRPGLDDKVLSAWNGLALTALARGYQVLGEPRYLVAATDIATFLQREMWDGETLWRVHRHGQRHTPGFLEDHAAVANGLVDLYEAGFGARWLRWAGQLAEVMLARFEDGAEGAFFAASEAQGDLLMRQKPGFDNAVPSGNTLAVAALLRLGAHLDREDFRTSAHRALACFGPWLRRAPRAFLGLLAQLDRALRESLEIVVAGDPSDPAVAALLAEVHRHLLPHKVLSLAASDPNLPLHRDRHHPVPAAYVCRGHACAAPVADVESLRNLLRQALEK